MAYNLPTWKPHTILCIEQVLNMKLSHLLKEIEMNLSNQFYRIKFLEWNGKD